MNNVTSSNEDSESNSEKEGESSAISPFPPTESGTIKLEPHIGLNEIPEITAEARKLIASLTDKEFQSFAMQFIYIVEEKLKIFIDKGYPLYLPAMQAWQDDEGSLWIQIESQDFRIGVILNPEIETSQWFQLLSKRLGGAKYFGPLSTNNLSSNIESLLITAIHNS